MIITISGVRRWRARRGRGAGGGGMREWLKIVGEKIGETLKMGVKVSTL
jgi:hypothetical protein